MKVRIICIGKLKEKYWTEAVAEYTKRISGYSNIEIVELKESKLRANPSPADEAAVLVREGETILGKIKDNDYVIAMEVEGKQLDSVELSKKLQSTFDTNSSTIDFIIGGSLGLSDEVKRRADYGLSFSKLTFPHQMVRVMLVEQIYRAFKISNGETYHK